MSVDMFMKMKGERSGDIQGEARDKVHKEEMDVLSFQWGMSTSRDSASGSPTGKSTVQNFTFTKPIDKSTPILATALINNEQIVKAVFTARKPGLKGGDPCEFTIITFEKARVAKISRGGESTDTRHVEEISLVFQNYTEDYTEQTQEGGRGAKTSASWSWSENTKL